MKAKSNPFSLAFCGSSSFYQSFALLPQIIEVDIAVMDKKTPLHSSLSFKSIGKFCFMISVLSRPSHFQSLSTFRSFRLPAAYNPAFLP